MWNSKIYKNNVKASGYKHQFFAILVQIIQYFAIHGKPKSPSSLLPL